MVNDTIDIHKLNLEELSGVIALYPWYTAARMELCRRLAEARSRMPRLDRPQCI